MRPRIFISYRRDISASSAKLIYRKMADEFGKNNIFMDIDNLNPGEDWRETIKANIAKSDITLVLIERDWSSIATATGKRLSDTKDMVRVEVETALERRNRGHIVIPVLLNGASMPSPTELPGRLGELSDIHAASIDTGKNHEKDIEDLIKDMKQRISLKRLLIYVLTALIIGLVIGFIIGQQPLNLVISPLQTAVVALFPQPSVTPSSTSPIIIPPVVDPIPPSVAVLLPTDTPTLTSTVTETSTSTNTPTFTSTYTFTPSATSTITPTATDTPMPTPSATLTPSPSIDVTSTLSPTQTCDLFVCSVTATAQALLPPILDANNINEIQQIGLLDDFDSVITGMVVSPDGKWLAVSTNKGDVWLKDATILLNTLENSTVKTRDIPTVSILRDDLIWPSEGFAVSSLVFSPDSRYIAIGTFNGAIILRDLANDSHYTLKNGAILEDARERINTLAFSSDALNLISGGENGSWRSWNVETKSETTPKTNNGNVSQTASIWSIEFNPEGTKFAVARKNGEVEVWNAVTNTLIAPLRRASDGATNVHAGSVNYLVFSPDGRFLATGGDDDVIRLWVVENGQQLVTFENEVPVTRIAFNPSQTLLAAGGSDGSVRLFDLSSISASQTQRAKIVFTNSHGSFIWGLAFTSPDGRWLFSGGNTDVRIWGIP